MSRIETNGRGIVQQTNYIKVDRLVDSIPENFNNLIKDLRDTINADNVINAYLIDPYQLNIIINNLALNQRNNNQAELANMYLNFLKPMVEQLVKSRGIVGLQNFYSSCRDFVDTYNRLDLTNKKSLVDSLVRSIKERYLVENTLVINETIVSDIYNGKKSMGIVKTSLGINDEDSNLIGKTFGNVFVTVGHIELMKKFKEWMKKLNYKCSNLKEFIILFSKFNSATGSYSKSSVNDKINDLFPLFSSIN